jgi:hypothetical protein
MDRELEAAAPMITTHMNNEILNVSETARQYINTEVTHQKEP